MIKLEHTVLASPEQYEFIIEGMRNPMNSWDKSDSKILDDVISYETEDMYSYHAEYAAAEFYLGENDLSRMRSLANAGTDHRKFMRMMPVYVRITAPLYWWKEFDTYKVGTVRNSCSTMHKIQAKEFVLDDFSWEHLYDNSEDGEFFKDHLLDTIDALNQARLLYLKYDAILKVNDFYGINPEAQRENMKKRQKDIWWQMIQLLPSSYNQTANVMLNYEVLANMYKSRKNHKLDEWREFCKWIEGLPYSELITGNA